MRSHVKHVSIAWSLIGEPYLSPQTYTIRTSFKLLADFAFTDIDRGYKL